MKAARGLARLQTSIRRLTRREQTPNWDELRKLPVAAIVKAQLPSTWFTKRHTLGRVREFQRAFAKLTPEQRAICYAKGWARWAR